MSFCKRKERSDKYVKINRERSKPVKEFPESEYILNSTKPKKKLISRNK